MLHQNLRPSKIFVKGDGQVKIDNFGSARLSSAIRHREVKGDPDAIYYLPPEYFGPDSPGIAGDIWTVGCILHEIMGGKRTFF